MTTGAKPKTASPTCPQCGTGDGYHAKTLAAWTDRAASEPWRTPEGPTCDRCNAAAIAADWPRPLERAGVPCRYWPASFEASPDLPAAIVERVRAWATDPRGALVLTGPVGAGKTWLAVAALRHALESGRWLPGPGRPSIRPRCAFVAEAALLDRKRQSYDGAPDSTVGLAEVDLLVYDDLASVRLTEWAQGELAGLAAHRYDRCLATIYTTNLSPDKLARALDARTASRLASDGEVLAISGQDLRLHGSLK